jgi:anaerobic dimethyl sulfoxide reductase subunit B (iron-sulfur subunit)
MQIGFYFDQSRCTGCYACVVACRDKHDIEDMSVSWRRLQEKETGSYPGVRLSYISLSCCHCGKPACAEACPVAAITKRAQDGIMTVDRDACLGGDACGACKAACPYGVPQFAAAGDDKMQMCTLCLDRLQQGKKPSCVDACPLFALDAGPMEELRKKYPDASPLPQCGCPSTTLPSMLIRPRYFLPAGAPDCQG